jgi:hypothetical protein
MTKTCGIVARSAADEVERGKPTSGEPTTILLFVPPPRPFLEKEVRN